MRKLYVPFAFLAGTTAIACSIQVGSNKPANQPAQQAAATPSTVAPKTSPAPVPTPKVTGAPLGALRFRRPGLIPTHPTATPSGSATAPAGSATVPTTPGTPALMTGTNAFGSGTADMNGYAGYVFPVAAGLTKIPDLTTMQPTGVLFASTLNVTQRAMTGGFPGIDATRNENFAIHWEAPLVVDNEADYTFRLSSDDGSIMKIDGLTIVDNDGNHTLAEKSGPVHLVKGTHAITVDYFQTTGSVALQLFCKRGTEAEMVCPTKL